MKTVKHCISYSEIADLNLVNGPFEAQIRLILNDAGFKFEDDGDPYAITNNNPKPLGVMRSWEDVSMDAICYEQQLDED